MAKLSSNLVAFITFDRQQSRTIAKCAQSSLFSSWRFSHSSEMQLPTAAKTRPSSDAEPDANVDATTRTTGTPRVSCRASTSASAMKDFCVMSTASVSVPGVATPHLEDRFREI
uniref:Uncharacterized protein n=1 Tax=Anopheles atroparvus TaxID=41427 RepID=A0AAG5DA50_ANOAO